MTGVQTCALPIVGTMITPLEPRAPYIELAAASFKTVNDSISWVEMEFSDPSYGTPSTTIYGSWLLEIEPIPRIRMLALDPGVPEEDVVCTPAIEPSKDFEISDTCIF